MNVALPSQYGYDVDAIAATNPSSFHEELLNRLRRLPDVENVAGITMPPLGGTSWNGTFVELAFPDEVGNFEDFDAVASQPGRAGNAEFRVASDNYFAVMDIPLLRGRAFERGDGPNATHVAVVSRSLAERQWPGEDPLGKLIQFGNINGDLTPFTVVGVVGDVRELGLEADARPTFYAYYRQRPGAVRVFWTAIRTSSPEHVVAAAREIVQRMNPSVPVEFVTSEQPFSASLAARRFDLVLLTVFGAAALLLALAGIYGAIAFMVARRKREIGLRRALGARRQTVVTMGLSRSVLIAGAGVAAGLAAAFAVSRLAASLLYGITPYDPPAYAGAAAAVLLAAVAAAWLPAARAARIDPMAALRDE